MEIEIESARIKVEERTRESSSRTSGHRPNTVTNGEEAIVTYAEIDEQAKVLQEEIEPCPSR
jgi:hypothetical protein